MYKLNGQGLGRGEWFQPETQPLTLAERESTSTITLGPDAPAIRFNDWLLQDDGPEGPIVWRVKDISDSTDTETVTVELEHVIKCLDDSKMFVEATTPVLAGVPGATTVTAKKAVQYILSLQNDWTLGDFAYNSVSNPYEFTGDSLLDALEAISDSLEDCVWEYDMSQYPFIMHWRQRDVSASCEMRGSRNLTTLRKSVSRTGMYTRIYPVGRNNLHIDGDYISKNESLYGRVDKIETDQTITTKAGLYMWANSRLNKHCEPAVSIQISGLELSEETGETLDRLQMNKICRVPLPKYGTTITERIVKKVWKDWIADRQSVTVTLANNAQDVAKIIRSQGKASGKAAIGNAKQNYLFEANGEHLYYEVFDDCGHLHGLLEMTEESMRIDFDNLINSTRSEFLMTSESLRIAFENEIYSTRSEFQMTSESLRIAFENEATSTRAVIEANSNKIGLVVGTNDSGGNYIKAGEICVAVNTDGTSEARIWGSKVTIGNSNTATVSIADAFDIETYAGVQSVKLKKQMTSYSDVYVLGANLIASPLSGSGGSVKGHEVHVGTDGSLVFEDRNSNTSITRDDMLGLIDTFGHVGLTGPDANDQYTLWYLPANKARTTNPGASGDTNWINCGTFSRATSLSEEWSSGDFPLTINAKHGNVVVDSTTIGFTNASDIYLTVEKNGDYTPFGNTGKFINVPFKIVHHAGGQVGDQTRYTSTLAGLDVTGVYDDGWSYGQTQKVRTTADATSQELTTKTLDYDQRWTITDTYTKPNGTTEVVKYTVASKSDRFSTGYNTGWNEARGAMVIPTSAIGATDIDGTKAKITIEKPDADGANTTTDYEYTLDINSAFQASGSNVTRAAELKINGNVVARKTITDSTVGTITTISAPATGVKKTLTDITASGTGCTSKTVELRAMEGSFFDNQGVRHNSINVWLNLENIVLIIEDSRVATTIGGELYVNTGYHNKYYSLDVSAGANSSCSGHVIGKGLKSDGTTVVIQGNISIDAAVTQAYCDGYSDGFTAGQAAGPSGPTISQITTIGLDAYVDNNIPSHPTKYNHTPDGWWNCRIYVNGVQQRYFQTDGSSVGLYMSTGHPTITSNGTWYPYQYSKAVFDYVVVNVPTSSGVTGLTRFYGQDTNHNQVENPTMYTYGYNSNGNWALISAGTHKWYYKD